ncbi:MAG: hypothetical protein JWN03_4074 [Nocardia sp.]|uniref:hypothetical protein n=1 Tax=Nocardia sp. TaxID=1821 RepID=UPI0026267640|nr:hypothetical protein [Nocardia sp.]MCU1643799.1 hypothetical protein [Nocardia sp.]
MTTWVRYARLGATTIAGVGAVLLAAAPNAAAYGEGNVAIEGSNPQVGCSYQVTSGDLVGGGSSSSNGVKVTFADNGTTIETGTVGTSIVGNPARVSWTPNTAGQHVLTATGTLGAGFPTITLTPLTVQVRASTSTGSSGCPLPSISG